MTKRPYHLCLVNSMRSYGGAEVWFLDTARRLQEQGVRVSLIVQPDAVWLPRIRAAGIPCGLIPMRMDAAPWTWIRLARWFGRHQVTAIVASSTKGVKLCAVAGRLAQVPVIFGTRESDFPLKDRLDYRVFFQQLATGLLVNSRATRDTILTSAPWLDPRRVHLLYKGIDTRLFTPADTYPPVPVVGFVGQLIERKGLPNIMAAWSLLEKAAWPDGQRPVLHLAGEGPLAADLQRWRAQLAYPDQVQWSGFCEDMTAFYRGLTLLIMPSLAEGFGLAAAEAGACGLPVIAARTSSLPEIVDDGRTGLLLPPEEPALLAEAMIRLCRNPALCRALGRVGRNTIETRFSITTCLDRLVALTSGQAQGDP